MGGKQQKIINAITGSLVILRHLEQSIEVVLAKQKFNIIHCAIEFV